MSSAAAAGVDALVWAAWSVVVGYLAHAVPQRWYEQDTWLTRIRAWERGGRSYDRLHIRKWKGRLPEAGAFFRKGTSKRVLVDRSGRGLERFTIETRRAEYVHVAIVAITPVFVWWNPPRLMAAMVVYAAAANLPCIAVQRFNRARLARITATPAMAAGCR